MIKDSLGDEDFENNNLSDNEECESEKFLLKKSIPVEFKTRYSERSIPDRIYIRKCYEELYDLSTEIMLNSSCTILFTGVPGIGKSMFMIYFLWRHQNDNRFTDKRFAFEIKSGVYNYYEPTNNNLANEYLCAKEVGSPSFHLDDILVVADIFDSTPPLHHAKWTLIFSSSNPSRYKQFMNTNDSYEFLVPTWSEQELSVVNPNVEEWYDRFIKCGES